MALSRIEGLDGLYVGGLWALRRSDSLQERGIAHVLSLFDPSGLKNFKDEPWTVYGKAFRHLLIDIDDVDESDLLIELPRAVRFIADGLQDRGGAAVFVHCAAGKSRSVAVVVAYLLWRFPHRFDPDTVPSDGSLSPDNNHTAPRKHCKETAPQAVAAALALVRRSRPLAEPNCGFMQQLAIWWEMGCPDDVETHPAYQRWAYRREVEESVAAGQAPSRLRFEDEQQSGVPSSSPPSSSAVATATHNSPELKLRCKKCRLVLAAGPFIQTHAPAKPMKEQCPHHFVEPLSWMRGELERGLLDGRLVCPNERCGTVVGRYDWKGLRCACGGWVTPGLSLQRARVDEERVSRSLTGEASMMSMGIRMPPGRGGAGSL
ncbi:hypothetical protein L249_8377 [Ophiocordyceps polyrhachis-furcata BCC 54312]|uniref:protein-tyrosine-phosphatase n=1 Tax=Ophiocordyceps polyrhachis-furcata BCC 54312 TaxID=1330021 RepID=A0A367L679_9HYPO|nr:hypothetical protein L249_8377 [Ophiocordyceps polyrhachis-furcata BCC 54312]